MNLRTRTHFFNILLSGIRFFKINDIIYCITYPSLYDIAYSEFLYKETIDKYKFEGWLTEDEYKIKLIQKGLLDRDFEQKLLNINNTINNFKIELFKCVHPSQEKEIRNNIKIMRRKSDSIYESLSIISGKTVEDMAGLIVNNYLLQQSIYDENMNKINVSSFILDKIMNRMIKDNITQENLRYLARNDPWRTYWSISKPNPFNVHFSQWLAEQRTIVVYSKLYDSVYENIECPDDNIINDDDKLDGWLLYQHKKRDGQKNEYQQSLGLEHHKDAQQIFMLGQTKKDIEAIDNLNSPHAKKVKSERSQQVKNLGEIKGSEFKDVKLDLQLQQNQAYTQAVKGRK